MSYPNKWNDKAPRLATIAKWINDHTTMVAEVKRSHVSTDRKHSGSRLSWPGKGRSGNRIKVWEDEAHWRNNPTGYFPVGDSKLRAPLLDHDSAETYRRNCEVVRWLRDHLRDHPEVLGENDTAPAETP